MYMVATSPCMRDQQRTMHGGFAKQILVLKYGFMKDFDGINNYVQGSCMSRNGGFGTWLG